MPTSRVDALSPLLAAVFALLNVSAVTDLATGGVWDEPPQNTAMPYVFLQAPNGQRWDAMRSPGTDATFDVHVVSNFPGKTQALAILDQVIRLVDGERPTVEGQTVVRLRWDRTETYRDPELVNGVPVYHAVGMCSALLDQA